MGIVIDGADDSQKLPKIAMVQNIMMTDGENDTFYDSKDDSDNN